MLEFLKDRKLYIWLIFLVVFFILFMRLFELTIVKGEELYVKSLNTRLKKVNVIAKRGEIYDRNGVLLATNMMRYSLEFLADDKNSKEQDEIIISIFKLLHSRGENYIKLPILYENGTFEYEADIQKKAWLSEHGFSEDESAGQIFEKVRYQKNISSEYNDQYAERLLKIQGITLPINIEDMSFTYDKQISNFQKSYEMPQGISANEAFTFLRKYYNIDSKYDDEEAYFILTMRDIIRSRYYTRYEPIKIAHNISKETAIVVEEKKVYYRNVSILFEPYRYYPISNDVSHVLGYMGYIATNSERRRYNPETGYQYGDMIGKIGIEGEFESELRGENGYEWISADASGSFVNKVNNSILDERFFDKKSQAGKDITITIDTKLQSAARNAIIHVLDALKKGGTYKSKYGDYKLKKSYPKAESAAVVVANVQNGEVLVLESFPDYNINLFATGITQKDWESLKPENERNPLAPKPLYNLATLTAVQPGSIFKMVTGFAALEQGLNPYRNYQDGGVIRSNDGRAFGCWIWNQFRGTHGPVNLIKALEVSCNYYFYNVSMGYDHVKKMNLDFEMNFGKIVETAAKFGLGSKSGVEIGELVSGLPDAQRKKKSTLYYLEMKLDEILKEYISEEIYSSNMEKEKIIKSILEIGEKNADITRADLMDELRVITEIQDKKKLEDLTDIIKYSYFNQVNWVDGDTYNVSIGQGENAYTPVQIVRYISAIANGGYLYDLTLIKNIGGEPPRREKYDFIDPNGNLKYIREGMLAVTQNSNGSAHDYFKNFPINVGAKTGTAEKEGKLPPRDEEDYLVKNLRRIAPAIAQSELEVETAQILKSRMDRIENLYRKIEKEKQLSDDSPSQAILDAIDLSNYLNRAYAMREAIKKLSDYKITDEDIDKYKDTYENFTWFVAFAPYEKPEIAIAVLIPQGGSGSYGALVAREIIGEYLGVPGNEEVELPEAPEQNN